MFYDVLMEKKASKKMMDALASFAGGGGSSKHRKMLANRFGVQSREQAEGMLARMRGQVSQQVKMHRAKQHGHNARAISERAYNILEGKYSTPKEIERARQVLSDRATKATDAFFLKNRLKSNRRLARQHNMRRSAGFDQLSPVQRVNRIARNRDRALYSGEVPLGYSSTSQKMREYGIPSQGRIDTLKRLNR